jgi:branched-chain amino acid transport system substrate-binding protein
MKSCRITRRAQLALSLAAMGVALLPVSSSAEDAKTIRIGVLDSMTGVFSDFGQQGRPAFQYVIDKVNKEGGIKSMGGAKIELVLADSTSQAGRAATEARRLITQENVALVVGVLLTPEMLAVSPIADEFKTPVLSHSAAGARGDYMYSMGLPYDRGYAKTMVDFVQDLNKNHGFNLKNVALVYSNYEAGQQVNKGLQRRLKEAGFTIAGEVPLDLQSDDQTAAMLRLKSLKADVALGQVSPRNGTGLFRARYSLGFFDTILIGGTAGYTDPVLWKDMGDKIGEAALTRNLFGFAFSSTASKTPALQKLVRELKANLKLTQDVGQSAIQGAQAARLIQHVLEVAGSTDREKIKAAFEKVNLPNGDSDLYLDRAGGLSFGSDHMPNDATGVMIQWKADKSQDIIYPAQFATAPPAPKK